MLLEIYIKDVDGCLLSAINYINHRMACGMEPYYGFGEFLREYPEYSSSLVIVNLGGARSMNLEDYGWCLDTSGLIDADFMRYDEFDGKKWYKLWPPSTDYNKLF